ncbi:hypothetical protein EJ08DRAFT_700449 [Tothia fuscella]|uniref:Uncharacterized protein n=1 Tax=Tothia fuscella TaxID=1048955 RepID=A0A9P4TVH4_9PEZI|nr:hypothetical protein EJ08DRAFT_700449 [Tothia fuscella]
MGLIKTAMLTGGGLYAVNKLAKTAEHRYDNNHQQQQQQQQQKQQQQGQGYRGGPSESRGQNENYQQQSYSNPPIYQDRPQNRDMYEPKGYPEQRTYSPNNNDGVYSPQYDYGQQQNQQRQLADANPPYYQQRESGYVVPENESFGGRQGKSQMPALMKMAQEIMGKK